MLYAEYDPEVEMRVVREEALEEGREIAREEDYHHFFELLNQGLTVDEIKERLQKENTVRRY